MYGSEGSSVFKVVAFLKYCFFGEKHHKLFAIKNASFSNVIPCSLRKTKDLPLPQRAYIPTVSGMESEGSHSTSAKALV